MEPWIFFASAALLGGCGGSPKSTPDLNDLIGMRAP